MSFEKNAARQAVAQHSTDPVAATLEYAKLTEQLVPGHTTEMINELQKEMLALLKPYRHPANDEMSENMIFIDPDGMKIYMQGHELPQFLLDLEKEEIAADTLAVIKEYVRKSEVRTIELNGCINKLNELKTRFATAEQIFKKYRSAPRKETRNSEIVKAIGLSTGTRKKEYNDKEVYVDYVTLIRKKGLARRSAVEELSDNYSLSYGTVINILNEQKSIVIKRWEESSPTLVPQIIKRLKGLVPQDR